MDWDTQEFPINIWEQLRMCLCVCVFEVVLLCAPMCICLDQLYINRYGDHQNGPPPCCILFFGRSSARGGGGGRVRFLAWPGDRWCWWAICPARRGKLQGRLSKKFARRRTPWNMSSRCGGWTLQILPTVTVRLGILKWRLSRGNINAWVPLNRHWSLGSVGLTRTRQVWTPQALHMRPCPARDRGSSGNAGSSWRRRGHGWGLAHMFTCYSLVNKVTSCWNYKPQHLQQTHLPKLVPLRQNPGLPVACSWLRSLLWTP